MRFSIITATLNSATTLPRVLHSLQRQTCHDLEHIIVDGGSTDGTLQIAHQYATDAPYPVYIINHPANGVYDALNRGIQAANGQVIGTLHADDRLYTDDVLQQVAHTLDQTDSPVLYGDVLYNSGRKYTAVAFTPQSLLYGFAPPHPGIFIRREMFDKYGLYNPEYLSAGDFDLMIRILLKGGEKATYLPTVVQLMDSAGRSSSWRYRLTVNLQEKRKALKANGYPAPWHHLLRRYLY